MEVSAVPNPDQGNSGVIGSQQAGSPGDIEPTPPPLEGELLPKTVIGLIAANPHSYGGDQISTIISAILSDAQLDKTDARDQVAAIQARLDQASEDLGQEKLANVRLEEQLRSTMGRSVFERFCLFCSPIALTSALDLFKAGSNSWLPIGALGIGLLMVNFWPSRGRKA